MILLTILQAFADYHKAHAFCTLFEVIKIFQYQFTVFMIQFHQMKFGAAHLMSYELWFTIEILSFYGYILSAMFYTLE